MTNDDIRKMMVAVAPVFQAFVAEAVSPVTARLDAIEGRFGAMPIPKDGTSVTIDDVSPLILVEVRKAADTIPEAVATAVAAEVAKIEPAKDGKDADPDAIKQMVADAVAVIPVPKDGERGKDADADAIVAVVVERMTGDFQKVHEILEVLQEPADPPELPDIPAMVQEAVAALPQPQDGKSVTADELRPLVAECVSAAVSALPAAKDGADVADLLIDRDGALVATLSNGRTKSLGKIVGRDGVDADVAALDGLKSQLDGALAEIAELRESVPASEISDEEFQRRVELATSQEAVTQRAKVIRESNGEARSLQIMRDAIVGAIKEAPPPAINVSVTMPKGRKEITTVKQHDEKGRILQFEKQEVDD